MSPPLTKSYVNTCDPNKPAQTDLIFSQLFDGVKKEKRETLFVNMDTGERVTNLSILDKGEKYARGFLTLGLEPGVDNIAVVGCATFEALAIFAAAAELGYGFSHFFFFPPRDERMATQLPIIAPKVIITGEGAGGHNFDALLSFFRADAETPCSERLPFVERIFYDSSYKDRSPSHKFIQTLDKLIKLGENVSDEQLLQAKLKVKPEFIFHHLFTSGSAGVPKCASRTQGSLAYFTKSSLAAGRQELVTLIMNMNVDTMTSYMHAIVALVGVVKKSVMVPESYEEKPLSNQGQMLQQIILDEEVNQLAISLSALTALVDHLKATDTPLPNKMLVPYGGQFISKQFIKDNQRWIDGLHLVGYGMTEVISIASSMFGYQGSEMFTKQDWTKFYTAPNTELRLVDDQGEVVDIGVAGEIQVKNPLAIKEYRNDVQRTKALFTEDGFLRTGDLAVMLDDGFLKMKGRIVGHERFKIFGKAEYAAPLEEIFNEHPSIRQTYVVSGKLNEWIGDEITSCIEMKSADERIPEDELLAFCKEKGMYQRQTPARILYFNEFPMTDNERKVSKLKLTAQVQAMVAEDEKVGKCKWFAEMEKSGRTY